MAKKTFGGYEARYTDIDTAMGIFDKKLGQHGANIAAEAITNRPEKIVRGGGRSNAPTRRDVEAFIRAARMVESGKLKTGGEVAFDQYRGTLQHKWMQNWKGRITDKTRVKYEAMGFNVPTHWDASFKGEIALRAATRKTKGTGADFFAEPNLPPGLKNQVGTAVLSPEQRDVIDVYNAAGKVIRRRDPMASKQSYNRQVQGLMTQNDLDVLGEVFRSLGKVRGK